ncbi:MAG: CapA family protein, partial [Herbinix sp.]|nr:CapA family protein [Herbinix sp.]
MKNRKQIIKLILIYCTLLLLEINPKKVSAIDDNQQEAVVQDSNSGTVLSKDYVGEIVLKSDKISLQQGDAYKLTATLTQENLSGKNIAYKSSNKKVVTVASGGAISALHFGEATVTATLGKAKASCKVTVSKDVTITISAAGDVTLSSDIKQPAGVNFFSVYNKQKDASYFFQNVRSIFDKDDMTLVNFEGTLSSRGSRVQKQWAFRGMPSYINILKEGSVEAVAFANNHVRDYGEVSYTDTIASFEKANITYSSYSQVGVYEVKGIRIGMISIQETGRSDCEAILRAAIKAMKKKKPELLIVSFHWGIE